MATLNFPNSPTLNQVYTANGFSWIWNGTSWSNSPSLAWAALTGKNKIIDGNFDRWDEGTSSSASGYGAATMWNGFTVGSSAVRSQQVFTIGQVAVPGEPVYFHRTVVTSVAGAGNVALIQQKVESVRTFAGQTCTLSFWAKADATKNMAIEFFQDFGSGGSPSTPVAGAAVATAALTAGWTKYSITVTLPSISGKTLGTSLNDNLAVNFWLDAGSNYNARTNSLGQQSGTFDIAQVQLEAGSVATPFEVLGMDQTLARVGRYYERIGGVSATATQLMQVNGTASSAIGFSTRYQTTKRVTPTVTKVGTWVVNNCAQPTATTGGTEQFVMQAVVTATAYAYFYSSDATQYVTADARL